MNEESRLSTREKIIYKSLELFSVDGFDAVSTRMIARAVGISDTAIYKHFKSKREIFDTIISICKDRFIKQSMKINIYEMEWSDVERICMDMFWFQTQDRWIVMFRRLLIMEQYKNDEMAQLYQMFFIDMGLQRMGRIFEVLMDEGYMKKCNPQVLAMELYAPFFMYHTVHPDSQKTQDELREHVAYFRENYGLVKDKEKKNG